MKRSMKRRIANKVIRRMAAGYRYRGSTFRRAFTCCRMKISFGQFGTVVRRLAEKLEEINLACQWATESTERLNSTLNFVRQSHDSLDC